MADLPRRGSGRHRLRVSVRRTMILILVLSFGLGWIVHRARVQREAVAAIKRAGGSVMYEHQLSPRSSGKPWWPKWAADILGIDYFDNVKSVFLEFKDSNLEQELAHIGRLDRLEQLYLTGSPVTDTGLASLSGLHSLRKLDLDSTEITDAGISHLAGLTGLQFLDLSRTKVGDAGMAHLGELAGLTNLFLAGTRVDDAGLAHLERLPSLCWLNISSTRITNGGIAHLRGLSSLEELDLSHTAVGQAGLADLKSLTGLKRLELDDTPITDAQAEALRKAMPNAAIYRRVRDSPARAL